MQRQDPMELNFASLEMKYANGLSLRNIREKWGHLSSYQVYSHSYGLENVWSRYFLHFLLIKAKSLSQFGEYIRVHKEDTELLVHRLIGFGLNCS